MIPEDNGTSVNQLALVVSIVKKLVTGGKYLLLSSAAHCCLEEITHSNKRSSLELEIQKYGQNFE